MCPAAQLEIVTFLVNTTLPQGSSHMFVCAVVADRQPVIVYRFNGERIASNSSKHTLVTNSTHGTLTVFNVQNSDEGTYSCSASNRQGSVSTSAVLTVQGAGCMWVYKRICNIQFLRWMTPVIIKGVCDHMYF